MSAEWWAVLIAGIVLLLGLVGHIIASVWWASRITTLVETAQGSITAMSQALKDVVSELKTFGNQFARKEDVAREMALHEKQLETMWDKFEKLKEKVDAER